MRHGEQHKVSQTVLFARDGISASCISPAQKSEIPTTPTIPWLGPWQHGAIYDQTYQIAFGLVYHKPLQTTSANFQMSARGMSSSKINKEILVLVKDWCFWAVKGCLPMSESFRTSGGEVFSLDSFPWRNHPSYYQRIPRDLPFRRFLPSSPTTLTLDLKPHQTILRGPPGPGPDSALTMFPRRNYGQAASNPYVRRNIILSECLPPVVPLSL